MTNQLLQLSKRARVDIYRTTADRLGLPALIIEKDAWICWTLNAVFSQPDALPMALKGGTSLSKVFSAIKRFSEDIDITVAFDTMPNVLAMSRSQRDKLSTDLRRRTAEYVSDAVRPHLIRMLEHEELGATVEFENPETLLVDYRSCFSQRDGYIATQVRLEFGGRNRTVPSELRVVRTYVAELDLPVSSPAAIVNVLSPIRTFWETVTLAHAECGLSEWRHGADRFARHWYDLVSLADCGFAEQAIVDRTLLTDVVAVKLAFWSRPTAEYEKCLSGECRLVPHGPLLEGLRRDYEKMIEAGMFSVAPPSFEQLVQRLQTLEARINAEFTRRPGTD